MWCFLRKVVMVIYPFITCPVDELSTRVSPPFVCFHFIKGGILIVLNWSLSKKERTSRKKTLESCWFWIVKINNYNWNMINFRKEKDSITEGAVISMYSGFSKKSAHCFFFVNAIRHLSNCVETVRLLKNFLARVKSFFYTRTRSESP